MALVRVYCGLASADPAERPASVGSTLTSAVVDDAGRLLHVCEIGDDPAGYAQLVTLLVERSGGPSGAAIAADNDDHTVTSLVSTAGRPLAVADDDSVDDFAERFADDDSLEEAQAPPVQRRAIGLARALQAGALSAVALPAPRDLAGYKPVLAAHAALANGRHSAAVALREVLRELFPAALQAYPDPAEPVALAVLDALPEPGMLASAGPDEPADRVVADLTAAGVAAPEMIEAAITALRVAVAETPRRAAVSRSLTSAVSTTVRQAVAAVRACDVGCEALVGVLHDRAGTPAPARRTAARRGTPIDDPASAGAALPTRPAGARRSPPEAMPGQAAPPSPRPLGPPPVAPMPVAPPPVAPEPIAPAAVAGPPVSAAPALPEATPSPVDGPTNRPISSPGSTPAPPSQRGSSSPAEAGEPFRATLTTAAIQNARAERQRTINAPRPNAKAEPPTPSGGFSVTDASVPVPTPRPSRDPAPPGSRANWPLMNTPDPADGSVRSSMADSYGGQGVDAPTDPGAENRVPPPWLADDMPQEPPVLRLVEPPPLADRALRDGAEPQLETPPLRVVDRDGPHSHQPTERATGQQLPPVEHRPPPVADDGDGDLLIFAQAKSAWFVGQSEDDEVDWSSLNDTGWQAAEQAAEQAAMQAAKPKAGSETAAGLPIRVPQANLVPGSPKRDDRPLRIVRDPASLAENTTGYFRGWRRGQEIGGFAVGGRPGREAAGGWDFTRDTGDRDEERKYEFRSAGYQS
ncbi:transposase [Salinispora fenicalii]|uniref:transposase n=1 Tax=Salinispora fenicalii TaxID=1137263 RepID=UPI0003A2B369|nr:transposase [Salinispora fenicalii]